MRGAGFLSLSLWGFDARLWPLGFPVAIGSRRSIDGLPSSGRAPNWLERGLPSLALPSGSLALASRSCEGALIWFERPAPSSTVPAPRSIVLPRSWNVLPLGCIARARSSAFKPIWCARGPRKPIDGPRKWSARQPEPTRRVGRCPRRWCKTLRRDALRRAAIVNDPDKVEVRPKQLDQGNHDDHLYYRIGRTRREGSRQRPLP